MMLWKHIGALALLALSASTALMQDPTAAPGVLTVPFPEVVVYEPETGALYNITAEGTQSGANLSDVPAFAGQNGYNYMLSPDRTKLVFAYNEMISDGVYQGTYYTADVASGACCTKLDPQDPNMGGVLQAVFSPDGTQLAASYHSNNFDPAIGGQVIVFNLMTGSVVARLDSSRLNSTTPGALPPGILFTSWTENGILVWPSCVMCEPALEGLAQYWNPADDSLSEPNVPYNMQDLTLANGERLRAAFDPAYPNNPDAIGMLPVPNVVTYAPASTDPTVPSPAQVIYFNPDNIYINRAQWVADGQAILIIQSDQAEYFMQSDEAYILLRDGTRVPLTIPMTRQFLAPTSDGWVMTDSETKQYVYYRLSGATVEEIVLDVTFSGYPVVVENPKFGASVPVGAMFPAISQP